MSAGNRSIYSTPPHSVGGLRSTGGPPSETITLKCVVLRAAYLGEGAPNAGARVANHQGDPEEGS